MFNEKIKTFFLKQRNTFIKSPPPAAMATKSCSHRRKDSGTALPSSVTALRVSGTDISTHSTPGVPYLPGLPHARVWAFPNHGKTILSKEIYSAAPCTLAAPTWLRQQSFVQECSLGQQCTFFLPYGHFSLPPPFHPHTEVAVVRIQLFCFVNLFHSGLRGFLGSRDPLFSLE